MWLVRAHKSHGSTELSISRSVSATLLLIFFCNVGGVMASANAALHGRQTSEDSQKIPAAARSCFAQAREAESRSDWKTAETEYLKAIELSPTWVEAIANLGTVYNRLGRTDDAISMFVRAAQIDPNVFGVQLNLGITYFKLGRYSDAEAPLRKAVSLDPGGGQPSSLQASTLLMLALFGQEKYAEVTPIAEKLLSTTPDDALVLETAGRSYFNLHDYKNATRTLQRRLTKKPETAELYLMLGQALDNAGDGESAIAALEQAIALSENAPLPDEHFDLGYILWKQRQFDRAEAEFRKELSRAPDHAPSTYYLGNIALERGDVKNAVSLLESAARAIPEDFAVHYDLGKALLQSGQISDAIEALGTAITLNPKKADAHYQLGLAFKRANRDDDAKREFETARKLNDEERADLERKVQGKDKQ